jgi:sigma-B regulation protein RsbU (phosphoserine phosphatase)
LSEIPPNSEPPVPQEDLEDLYENAPCGYLSMLPDGRIFRANATLARWLGLQPGALIDTRFRDLLSVPSRIVYETNLAPLIQTEAPFEEVVIDLLTASGTKLPVLINGVHRRDEATHRAFRRLTLIRARDRRRYERELLASRDAAEAESELSHEREAAAQIMLADAREASALREQFIAVLGHDLRNPLASIAGAARLLRKQPQNDKSLTFIGLMETSVDRMAGLIDNVLDFARGRLGGGLSLTRADVQLEPLLRQVIAELRSVNPDHVIETDFSFAQTVRVDPTRFGQLVSNLLGNAVTHGDPKTPIRLGGAVAEGTLELWVANGGEPISKKAMERLFQPFFRGEVRASQQGLGLGLYIASEIAAAHGGVLTVRSDRSETRFTLRMPAEPPDPPGVR